MIAILKLIHCNFKVNFEVDSINTLLCTIGVKQSDILKPALFVIFIGAVMLSKRKTYNRPLRLYRMREDFVLTGRRYNSKGTEFAVKDSECADDTAVLFESRDDIELFAPLLISHFQKLEIYVGDQRLPDKPSKTEVLFVAKATKMMESNINTVNARYLEHSTISNFFAGPLDVRDNERRLY